MKSRVATFDSGRMTRDYSHIVGIDEVGRGPLAGPVAVCAAMTPASFDFSVFPKLGDSKQLSEKVREEIFTRALDLQYAGKLRFAVHYESPEAIDLYGIEEATRRALESALSGVCAAEHTVRVFLDGRLKAPPHFPQETIIGGDALVPIISLASVIAKVSRDRIMADLCRLYPAYGFSRHKGYGTAAHRKAIAEYGLSPLHRKSFCKQIALKEE